MNILRTVAILSLAFLLISCATTTPLMQATQNQDFQQINKLLNSGAEIDELSGKYGETALMLAARQGKILVVSHLVSKGADINKIGKYGDTPLIAASYKCNYDIMSYLIHIGANNIDSPNKGYGSNALMLAAECYDSTGVEILLENNANIHLTNNNGGTAMTSAARKGNTEIIKLLLGAGADINHIDNHGNSALHMAAFGGHYHTVEYLLSQGCSPNIKSSTPASVMNRLKFIDGEGRKDFKDRDEVKLGKMKEIISKRTTTPLMLAAQKGHTNIVTLLIKNGAELDIQDISGKTALNIAKEKRHLDIVELLLGAGANETTYRSTDAPAKVNWSK